MFFYFKLNLKQNDEEKEEKTKKKDTNDKKIDYLKFETKNLEDEGNSIFLTFLKVYL